MHTYSAKTSELWIAIVDGGMRTNPNPKAYKDIGQIGREQNRRSD